MSIREVLSPLLLGAEVLVRVTQKRSTGRLQWSYLEHSVEIIFVSGRPQVMVGAGGKHCFDRLELEKGLRLFGSASAGNYAFHPLELSAVAHFESLRVDTMGIVQVAMLEDLGATQLTPCGMPESAMRFDLPSILTESALRFEKYVVFTSSAQWEL